MNNPVQQKGIGNKRYTVGLCYAMIPENIDRDVYVADCKRRGRVSVQDENGSFVIDCPVGLSILSQIEFPDEIGQLGSQLIYVNEHKHNKPIIIDRVLKDDESSTLNENEFQLERSTDSGNVSINGVAKDGNLFINVESTIETGGKLFIDVGNSESTGGIVVNLKGNFQMELQEMVINAIKGITKKAVEDININSAEGVINLGDTEVGVEPVLKGGITQEQINKTNNLLQALVDVIGGTPVTEPGNGAPSALQTALSGAISGQTLGDFSDIKSGKTFTE